MKKVFLFLASAMMIVAAVSCQKGNKPSGGKTDKDNDDEEEVGLINIDGKFDDWSKAAGVKTYNMVASNNGIEIDGQKQRVDALKTVKVVADPYYIYLYLEVDMSTTYAGGVENWEHKILTPAHPGPVDIYIDADCKTTKNEEEVVIPTGGIQWVFANCGWEYLFECGSFFASVEEETNKEIKESGEMPIDGYNFDVFTGADGTDVWAAGGPYKTSILKSGMAKAYRVHEGNTAKAEISFIRTFLPKITGNQVKLGVIVQSTNWMLTGCIPQVASVGGETPQFNAAEFLTLDLPAEE